MNYEEKLIELAFNNPNIVVLTAENRASIRNLPNIIKDKFIDTGINEQSLVGISAGLALRGRIPIVHALIVLFEKSMMMYLVSAVYQGFIKIPLGLVGLHTCH